MLFYRLNAFHVAQSGVLVPAIRDAVDIPVLSAVDGATDGVLLLPWPLAPKPFIWELDSPLLRKAIFSRGTKKSSSKEAIGTPP